MRRAASAASRARPSVSMTRTGAPAGAWGHTVTGTGAGPARSVPVSQAPVRSSARTVSMGRG
jgi:hypothetical protein